APCRGRSSRSRRAAARARRSAAPAPASRPAASYVEPGVLEVEGADDATHPVVADHAFAPQLRDGLPLGVEQLASQPLVVLRASLRRAVGPRGGARGGERLADT